MSLNKNPPKKIFIDCGANRGQGLLVFDQTDAGLRNCGWEGGILGDPNWVIYSFEANPFCSLTFLDGHNTSNVTFENKAVWIKDEELTLQGTSRFSAAEAAEGRGHSARHVLASVRLDLGEFYKGPSKSCGNSE